MDWNAENISKWHIIQTCKTKVCKTKTYIDIGSWSTMGICITVLEYKLVLNKIENGNSGYLKRRQSDKRAENIRKPHMDSYSI